MAAVSDEPGQIDSPVRICRLFVDQDAAITAISLPACFALRRRDRAVHLDFDPAPAPLQS